MTIFGTNHHDQKIYCGRNFKGITDISQYMKGFVIVPLNFIRMSDQTLGNPFFSFFFSV